jgi:rubredoxin
MNIIKRAFDMAAAVEKFLTKAKRFYYLVMLIGCRCPKCNGQLTMMAEGKCRCNLCGYEFDPTIEFQRCSKCGGTVILRVRRYQCKDCSEDITSRFLFDGLIFNAEYFKQKVAESRQRKKELKESVRQMLAECRSADLSLQGIDLSAVPDLTDALNSLTAGITESFEIESKDEFNLKRYEGHIQAYIQDFPVSLEEIPPLNQDNARKDRIWRFIAIIFLAHDRVVDVMQDGQEVMVKKHETNSKGCGVFGEIEDSDRIEGSVGRVEA